MKRLFFFVCLLGLAACDRPQYDVQLVCEDGAKGQFMVDAKVYDNHADLSIKRLTKELRVKPQGQGNMWLADHTWLYNQVPQIDDIIDVSLPVNESGEYEFPGKIKFDLDHNGLTGGMTFTLWYAADNNLTMANGEPVPDGEFVVGANCEPVLYPVDVSLDVSLKGMSAEQIKEVKNCMWYLQEQMLFDGGRIIAFDENTGREMYISRDILNTIFNGVEPNHYYLYNARLYPDDAKNACEVANRLRDYIATHIDSEYIAEPENVVSVSYGETITITCGNDDIVIKGN